MDPSAIAYNRPEQCHSLGNYEGMGSSLHKRSLSASEGAEYSLLEKRGLIKRDAPDPNGEKGLMDTSGNSGGTQVGTDTSKDPKKKKGKKEKGTSTGGQGGDADPAQTPTPTQKIKRKAENPHKEKKLQEKIEKQQKQVDSLKKKHAEAEEKPELLNSGGSPKGGTGNQAHNVV
ncbi:hypothetical protein PSTT_03417 [Puccinia striiformis]|uniref:Uncharacterized protein n=1 Tax=Puccinia striiformis TaxID=27350 RepID=A0A2S4VWA8_9BASI|nr:hypothetical protein PSTT_03417 [Puccinia striiformis]